MLSSRIKLEREKCNLSQLELSKHIGVSQQTVGSWEVGRTEPASELIIKIADFFNVTADYLLGRNKAKENPLGDFKPIPGNWIDRLPTRSLIENFIMRVQPENFEKIKRIAEVNNYSITMQIEFLLQECITEFENKYGRILLNEELDKIVRLRETSGDRNDISFKLYFEPEGILEYIFDDNDETFQGSLKYTFGYYNTTRNFLLLEQVEGDLISGIINSKSAAYLLCILKLLNTNLEIPYNHMSWRVDIFFSFQGEYKEFEVGRKETVKANPAGVIDALPKDNEQISKWLKKSVSERKDFWRKELERIHTKKDR